MESARVHRERTGKVTTGCETSEGGGGAGVTLDPPLPGGGEEGVAPVGAACWGETGCGARATGANGECGGRTRSTFAAANQEAQDSPADDRHRLLSASAAGGRKFQAAPAAVCIDGPRESRGDTVGPDHSSGTFGLPLSRWAHGDNGAKGANRHVHECVELHAGGAGLLLGHLVSLARNADGLGH